MMYDRWSLDVLYHGVEDPSFKEDMETLKNKIAETISLADEWAGNPEADAASMVKRVLSLRIELGLVAKKLYDFLGLSQSVETTNTTIAGLLGVVENKMTKTTKADVMCDRRIAAVSNLQELIDKDPFLKEHEFYLNRIVRAAEHMLSDDAEEMAALMNLNAGSSWSKLSDYLTSTVKVSYDGRITNIPEVRGLATNPDRNVRKAAFEAEIAAYPQIADSMAYALNNIKTQVNHLSAKRGYESALDQTLSESSMKRETLDAMLGAMRKYMPKFHEYMQAKARYMGIGDRLNWYDIIAPIGQMHKTYTKEEAHQYLVESFRAFSDDMADMMDRAFRDEWIDFDPRPGKVGGAFCAEILNASQSRILTNFDGSFDSVDTLAHELGHAYHGMHVQDHTTLNHDYCMQLAETASTFNETHIMLKAISEAEGEEKLALLEGFLANTNQVICDIYSRFLFESEVFARCEEEFLMPEQLNEIMLRAQEEAYGTGLNPECRHPYMWVCKSHYYSEGLSYYNFPYAFGALFAMGLYRQYQKEGTSFVPKYQALLHATPVKTVEDVAAMAGIDVTKKEFWEDGLQAFADLIDEFVGLTAK